MAEVFLADFVAVKIGRVRMSVAGDNRRKFVFSLKNDVSDRFPMIVTFLLVSSNDLHMRIELNGTVISIVSTRMVQSVPSKSSRTTSRLPQMATI